MTFHVGRVLTHTLFVAVLAATCPAVAQEADTDPATIKPGSYEVDFSADQLIYEENQEIVTARGNVLMTREGNRLNADEVIWNRKSGEVRAKGNVRITSPAGDTAFGDSIELTDTLKDGVVDNLLIVLSNGGRLVAARGDRTQDITRLEKAAYTPCRVVDDANCPKDPAWKITALEVRHDPTKNRIYYKDAQLELFGTPIATIPRFSHIANDQGGSGLLIPDIRVSNSNGLEISQPYYWLIDRNRDLTLTPHLFSKVLPAIEGRYRELTGNGAYQVGGYFTYGSRIPVGVATTNRERDLRGYLESSGKFQFTPRWSVRGSLRLATDRTFVRRYDISRDDVLRNTIAAERISRTSYFSASAWGFQTLRPLAQQGQVPIALPIIEYRKLFDEVAGGRAEINLNSIALSRTSGQDTQRAFTSARWDLRRIIGSGQEVQFTAFARGDIYHTDEGLTTLTPLYRGTDGWTGRAIGAAAAEIRWPFIGPAFGGTQRLTPRVQIVASPTTSNLNVPNEDSRAVDLEDSNLFSLNRFPGHDRWEDGARITYGLDWALDAPGVAITANIGQSYRLNNRRNLFPDGTGLSDRTSDIVGRTTIKYKKYLSLSHRYRLDKDSLAIRRNEMDVTAGTDKTYVTAGYLRLNRDIGPTLEDLRDREEIRLGGRLQVKRYWSVFGSTIIDLTDRREDPITLSDGYEPIRHRLGVAYEDDCLRASFTWKRDYGDTGDARRGNTYLLQLSFRNLGR
jgi:LPS-assembly protein